MLCQRWRNHEFRRENRLSFTRVRQVVLTLAFGFGVCIAAPITGIQAQENAKQGPSDAEIRSLLMQESIASYSGACPCPETRKSNGALCGASSAYSRPGGDRPLCYPNQVTEAMIKSYREALAKR